MLQANKNGLSIQARVTIYATIIAIAILAVASVITFKLFSSQFKKAISDNQYNHLSSMAVQLDARLLLAQHQLELFANTIDSDQIHSPEKLQILLDGEKDARSTFDAGFVVISVEGRMLAASPTSLAKRGEDYSFREYVKRTLTSGKPYISNPFKTRTPPYDPQIAFSVPIKNSTGKTIALVAGLHNLLHGSFLQSLADHSNKNFGYTFIFSLDRIFVVNPDKSRIMEYIKPGINLGFEKVIKEGFEGSLENVNSRGVAGITTFKRLKNAEWYLGSHVPITLLYQQLFTAEYQLIAVFVLLSVLAGLVMWLVMGRMMSPLQALINQIDSIHTKNCDERLLPNTYDGDLGHLSNAFNNMVTKFNLQQDAMVIMQAALERQKAFAEELLNKAAVPIFVLDVNHRIVVWNNAIVDMTGLRAEDMIGTNRQWIPFYVNERPVLADLVLSADNSQLEELYDTHRTSQHVRGGQQAEGWLENVGGQRRYLLFDAAPVFDSAGVKLGVIETLLDITGRKEAEDEQRKLSWAVSENPCSIVITDKEGTIEYVNRKFCEVTGYSAEETIGHNPRILKSGEMSPEGYATMWHDVSHGKTWHGEYHNKKKNGELYWEIASISAVMNEDGQITNYLAVKEDITERKHNEIELTTTKNALEEKHKQLNQVFSQMEKAKQEWESTLDCISDIVLMCDTSSKIKRCNRPITDLTGLPFNEILDMNWMTLLNNTGIQVVDFDGQHGNLFDQNSGRSFEMNVFQIKQSGNPLQSGSVVSIHDTTIMKAMNSKLEEAYHELQQTQGQILQQEKMASIGSLAAGVAHEINNPMGFISSNLSSLGKYMEKISAFNAALMEAVQSKGDTETLVVLNELRKKMKIDFILGDISGLLAESHDGAERVRRIVQDLKSFSHVDEAECKPFSINECLTSTLNMARNEIKYVADIEEEYDPDLPLLNCYPQQLNQVFMNIMVNAAHAIEVYGTIKIKTEREADDIVVRISDTGKGIAPEHLTRIFEPFFTTKEVGKGTGLGLSISYDIIKKHGGMMNVESEIGIGTTFVIRLPINHQFAEGEVAT